ncbi:MAG: ABC transporter permease [Reyranella sp.]|nr:ABC transporter permease [Reyranella sp.]MBL6650313.1 ABC transporter permease [Reyranella sp.]
MRDSAAITSPRRRRLSAAARVGIAVVLAWAGLAVFGPYLAPYRAGDVTNAGVFGSMTAAHPFGTDYLGRDMLSRILYGARYTVGVAMVATVLACLGGVTLGILSAVRRGWTDSLLGRAADALISIPHLMFALVVVAAFGTSLPVLILMAALSYVPGSYRFARALAIDVNAMDFIEVARARGERTAYVVWAEILPNMIVPLLTDFGLRFVFVVLLLSGLSFLGLGIQPPNADWGALVRENITGIYEAAPAVLMPAVAIAALTISITLLIDGFSGRGSGHGSGRGRAMVR